MYYFRKKNMLSKTSGVVSEYVVKLDRIYWANGGWVKELPQTKLQFIFLIRYSIPIITKN